MIGFRLGVQSFGLMFHDKCMLVMVLNCGGGVVSHDVDSASSGSGGAVEAPALGSDAADAGDDAPYPLGFRVYGLTLEPKSCCYI